MVFIRGGKDSPYYTFWRNKVQRELSIAKQYYYHNKLAEVDSINAVKWCRQIKSLTGQDIQQEWYHQFLDESRNTQALAKKINIFFVSLTEHFSPLTQAKPSSFVPQELFVYRSLSTLNIVKAVGPDKIPNKLPKDFALELAPVIQDIYNQTLEEGHIPTLLKSLVVTPIPKVTPPREIESDLRPISLMCTLAKVM